MLFEHVWHSRDELSPNGDGLGPVFNARSCVECHNQGGVGGGGDVKHNVTSFVIQSPDGKGETREGVIHAYATSEEHRETLAHLDRSLPRNPQPLTLSQVTPMEGNGLGLVEGAFITLPSHIQLSQRNTPALFGARLIDAIPDRVILAHERSQRVRFAMAPNDTETLPVGRVSRLSDGRIGRFGWKGQTAHLSDFVEAACANELGLGNPKAAQPVSLASPSYKPRGLDLTQLQCDQLTAFVSSLDRPVERLPEASHERSQASAGKDLFKSTGCADCHTPTLGSVEGIYSDLLLHRMGEDLVGGGLGYSGERTPPKPTPKSPESPGPLSDEWRTPPLWGVADSAPYMHDGRAPTLEEAIKLHKGQATASSQRFTQLKAHEQVQLIAFLKTLRAP